MALIDEVIIRVKGGKGGDGANAFKINFGSQRRVPDGGSGGNGGNVYFEGSHNLNDLNEFRFKKTIKAEDGENGSRKTLLGKNGEDIVVKVPLGTIIIRTDTKEFFEIIEDGEKRLVARGGRKGFGNYYYKIDKKNFTPSRTVGEEGEELELKLILNLIADIGLVGLPNAGKSSLLSKLTKATPKIGDYPFTTLEPNLGVFKNMIIADIPGLVEGAYRGRGLGISFLKHIKKTKMLVHLIDVSSVNVLKDYNIIIEEFKNFSDELLNKNEINVLSKSDLVDEKVLEEATEKLKILNKRIYRISIYNEKSINSFKKVLVQELEKLKGNDN